jgi:hypothetical protein
MYIDGYVVVRSGTTGSLKHTVINGATGAVTSSALRSSGETTYRTYGNVLRRADGEYVIAEHNSFKILYWNIGDDLSAPAVKESGEIAAYFSGYYGNGNYLHRSTQNPALLVYLLYNQYQVFDFDDLKSLGYAAITGYANGASNITPLYDTARASDDFGTIRVRATGVLTTEA